MELLEYFGQPLSSAFSTCTVYLSSHFCISLSFHRAIHKATHPSTLSSIHPSIHPPIHPSFHPPPHPSTQCPLEHKRKNTNLEKREKGSSPSSRGRHDGYKEYRALFVRVRPSGSGTPGRPGDGVPRKGSWLITLLGMLGYAPSCTRTHAHKCCDRSRY